MDLAFAESVVQGKTVELAERQNSFAAVNTAYVFFVMLHNWLKPRADKTSQNLRFLKTW